MSTAFSDAGFLFANGDTQAYPSVPVRQTVLSGTVDSSGFSSFGGSTGSTTVTASTTLIATAANGATNRTSSIVNPSWTGLSTNGTMYLGLTLNADGTCTPFVTTLAPTYQWGGTFSVTSNQRTFNIQAMQMQVGNGTTAAQAYDVFVGEVTVAGGVVTAIVWYALMGRYDSGFTATLPSPSTQVSKNHNLGTNYFDAEIEMLCTTADGGYTVGDVLTGFTNWVSGSGTVGVAIRKQRNSLTTAIASSSWQGINITTSTAIGFTASSWSFRFIARRRGF
jgi:hypothetical protein